MASLGLDGSLALGGQHCHCGLSSLYSNQCGRIPKDINPCYVSYLAWDLSLDHRPHYSTAVEEEAEGPWNCDFALTVILHYNILIKHRY